MPTTPPYPRPGDRSPEAGRIRLAAFRAEEARIAALDAIPEPPVAKLSKRPWTAAERAAYDAGMQLIADHPRWRL